MTDLPRPPAHVAPYVEVLGVDDAILLFTTLGGSETYIPSRPGGASAIVRLLGRDPVERLAQRIGGGIVRVPLAKPWVAAVWYGRGTPVAQIARDLGVTDWTVRRMLASRTGAAAPGADSRQLRLL